jgi:protein-tyrosine phosphatase
MAERMMRALVPPGIAVTSAGTRARRGQPMWPEAVAELARRGQAADGFASRPVTAQLVTSADLVLTATRAHRDEVVSATPSALRRVFTWNELAWLLDGVTRDEVPGEQPSERLQALPALASLRRGRRAAPARATLDVADPVGAPPAALLAAADAIAAAVGRIARLL